MNIVEAIKRVTGQHDLSVEDMVSVMTDIMTGNTTDAQNAAFLVGLQMKGIKVPEILGGVSVMRELSTKVVVDVNRSNLVDTCGTEGVVLINSMSRPLRLSLQQLLVQKLPSMAIEELQVKWQCRCLRGCRSQF